MPATTRPLRYEQRLNADRGRALAEGSLYFDGGGEVRATLGRVTRLLDEISVPYAVAGVLALFQHGFRRFTESVELLVGEDGLRVIHDSLPREGFAAQFPGSRHLCDTASGVCVRLCTSTALPSPERVADVMGGVRCLTLPALVELQIRLGEKAVGLSREWIDVQELIRVARLPRELADRLHPDVRAKYLDLWNLVPAGSSACCRLPTRWW